MIEPAQPLAVDQRGYAVVLDKPASLANDSYAETFPYFFELCFRSRQKGPVAEIRSIALRVCFKDFRRIDFRIGGDADEKNVALVFRLELVLQPKEIRREQRANVRAGRINKVQNDDLAAQIRRKKSFPVLID